MYNDIFFVQDEQDKYIIQKRRLFLQMVWNFYHKLLIVNINSKRYLNSQNSVLNTAKSCSRYS